VRWRSRRTSLLAGFVGVLAFLAGCTAGPSHRPEIVVNEDGGAPAGAPPTSAEKPPVPPLEEPTDSSVHWGTCQDSITAQLADPPLPNWLQVQCARVNTTLDSPYAPGRGTLRLQVLKAGNGPNPILVVNDAGGLPGTIYAARLAATLPQEFFTTFSLIGLDRRGTGLSDPPDCVPKDVRASFTDMDPANTSVGDWLEAAKTAGQQCSIDLESRLPALDTWRTSVDLDNVRVALGLRHLNAIGHGEGSRVLGVYADRYADRVGRFVLDGLPDTPQDVQTQLEKVAAGAEDTWKAFIAECKAPSCDLGAPPGDALNTVLEQLRNQTLPTATGLDLGPGLGLRAILTGLSDRKAWPALATAINKVRHGDGGPLAALISPVILGSVWPVATTPVTAPAARNTPPIVVIATASDPVTPQAGTERAAEQLSNAAVVSWQGAGHGALGQSSCATSAATAFLADGKVPTDGTACPP
jgi:pimeloyl-ACP methyl ester carboxylesterase